MEESANLELTDRPDGATADSVASRPLNAGRALWILAAYVLTQLGIAILLLVLVEIYYGVRFPDRNLLAYVQRVWLLPAALLGLAGAAPVVFSMTRRTLPGPIASGALRPIGWDLGSRQERIASAVIGALLASLTIFVLLPLVPPRPNQSLGPLAQAASTPGLLRVIWALAAIGVAPPVEEFLFRGVLLEGLRRSWGTTIAAVLVTALFIFFHLFQTDYWPAIVGVTLLAVATVCVRLKTGALGPSLVMHLAYNLVPVITVFVRGA